MYHKRDKKRKGLKGIQFNPSLKNLFKKKGTIHFELRIDYSSSVYIVTHRISYKIYFGK